MEAENKTILVASTTQKQSLFSIVNILRCIYIALELLAVAVFLELIIAGLMLGLSIKIILFVVILLIVSTVFSRRWQLYFYILFLLILSGITIWTLNPDIDGLWQTSRFDQELALLSPEPIPQNQNAAVVYQKLLDEYDGSTFHPNLRDLSKYGLTYTSVIPTDTFPDIVSMIECKKQIIENLLQAAAMDKCVFPVPADMNEIKTQQYRVAVMKIWARLLLNSANNDFGDGNIESAIQKQQAVLTMADHLYQQRTIFDNSAAIYIELMAFENVNSFIMNHCDNESLLDVIASRLQLVDQYYPENWDHIYDSMKLVAKNTVALLYESRPDGKSRRSHNIAPTLNHHFSAKMQIDSYQMSVVKAGAVGHWFVLPGTVQSAARMIDKAFDEFSPSLNPGRFQRGKPGFQLNYKYVCRLSAHYAAKFYYAIQTQSKRRANAARSTRILIELKRYYLNNGHWPQSIEELTALPPESLVDSVNDMEFVYRLTPDSFILYSAGRNKVDDNALANRCLDSDDLRYWPKDLPQLQ